MKRTVLIIISLLMITCMLYGLTTPVLINDKSCWRGIVQPGRNCISKGDTISAIFSQITTDPNDFQRFTQAYSVDGGATWNAGQIGLTNCERTYPHQDQIDHVGKPGRPYSIDPQLIWLEKHYPGGTGEVYYAHDDLVPYQLFTPVEIKDVKGYFPTLCVWGITADTIFATSCDVGTDDIYGWRSEDHGATWIDDGAIIPNAGAGGQVAPMVDNGTDGYSFMIFGRQGAPGLRVPAQYCESVDYGATWTAYDTVGNMPFYPGKDILSIAWRGYSMVVDGSTNTPYIACELNESTDPSTAVNVGELYFTKPISGSPGAYVFGDWVGVSIAYPDSYDYHMGDPTIGFYYSDAGIVLYIIYSEQMDAAGYVTREIVAATSTDEGVTWNIDTVTTPDDSTNNKAFTSAARYVTADSLIHVVYHRIYEAGASAQSNDLEEYELWHTAINVVTDLGLPAPVGVEEGLDIPQIFMYEVSTFTRDNLCTFRISLPEGGHTTLDVYDALGRRVATVYDGYLNPGINNVEWNVEGIASGSYIYRLTANGFTQSDKVLVY